MNLGCEDPLVLGLNTEIKEPLHRLLTIRLDSTLLSWVPSIFDYSPSTLVDIIFNNYQRTRR